MTPTCENSVPQKKTSLLRGEDLHHEEVGHEEPLREKLADLTQIVSYHFPEQAFQLFAVKEIDQSVSPKPSAACGHHC